MTCGKNPVLIAVSHQINHYSDSDWLQIVRRHIGPLRYGSVEIIVQDSRIIQIQTKERWRLQKDSSFTVFQDSTTVAPVRSSVSK
jgi:hypothetical protein